VLAFDPYPQENLPVQYVSPDTLFENSDILSLHCPLTPDTRHIINRDSLEKMKPHAILINTSRGGLIETTDLIEALKTKKLGGAGLDVYEEEGDYFFEDFSSEIVQDDALTRLLSFPNVVVSSHQGFFTKEAMEVIAQVTLDNVRAFKADEALHNEICYQCTQKEACPKDQGTKRCF